MVHQDTLILPALFLTAVFSIIGTFQLFNEANILQPQAPGSISESFTPNLYAYAGVHEPAVRVFGRGLLRHRCGGGRMLLRLHAGDQSQGGG